MPAAGSRDIVCYQYRMLWRRSFALLLALLALAAPTPSFAQNAGQDQYQDPLAGGDGGSGGSTGTAPTGTAPTGTAPTSTPSTGTTTAGTGTDPVTGAQTSNGELPRTGFDVVLTVELGLALLLLGIVSQRTLVLRERRDQR